MHAAVTARTRSCTMHRSRPAPPVVRRERESPINNHHVGPHVRRAVLFEDIAHTSRLHPSVANPVTHCLSDTCCPTVVPAAPTTPLCRRTYEYAQQVQPNMTPAQLRAVWDGLTLDDCNNTIPAPPKPDPDQPPTPLPAFPTPTTGTLVYVHASSNLWLAPLHFL